MSRCAEGKIYAVKVFFIIGQGDKKFRIKNWNRVKTRNIIETVRTVQTAQYTLEMQFAIIFV